MKSKLFNWFLLLSSFCILRPGFSQIRYFKCDLEKVEWSTSTPGSTIVNPSTTTPQMCIEQKAYGGGNAHVYAISINVSGLTGVVSYVWPVPIGDIEFVNSSGTVVLTTPQTGNTVYIRSITPITSNQSWGKGRLRCDYMAALNDCKCSGFATLDLFKQVKNSVTPIMGPLCVVAGQPYNYSVEPIFTRLANVSLGIGMDRYKWSPSAGLTEIYTSGDNSSLTYIPTGTGPWSITEISGTTCNNDPATITLINSNPGPITFTSVATNNSNIVVNGNSAANGWNNYSSGTASICLDAQYGNGSPTGTPVTNVITNPEGFFRLTAPAGTSYDWIIPPFFDVVDNSAASTLTSPALAGPYSTQTIKVRPRAGATGGSGSFAVKVGSASCGISTVTFAVNRRLVQTYTNAGGTFNYNTLNHTLPTPVIVPLVNATKNVCINPSVAYTFVLQNRPQNTPLTWTNGSWTSVNTATLGTFVGTSPATIGVFPITVSSTSCSNAVSAQTTTQSPTTLPFNAWIYNDQFAAAGTTNKEEFKIQYATTLGNINTLGTWPPPTSCNAGTDFNYQWRFVGRYDDGAGTITDYNGPATGLSGGTTTAVFQFGSTSPIATVNPGTYTAITPTPTLPNVAGPIMFCQVSRKKPGTANCTQACFDAVVQVAMPTGAYRPGKGHTNPSTDSYQLELDLSKKVAEGEMLKVFPNPSDGEVTIEGKSTLTDTELVLMTSEGKVLKTIQLGANKTAKVNKLTPGVYMVAPSNGSAKPLPFVVR